jgi:DUF438 domain-containing protein
MSSFDERKEILKNVIKLLHSGSSVEELKEKYGDLLSKISPFEIPLIEQELVKEGISIKEILNLCDLHVALFRDSLAKRELKGIPEGHPLDLLIAENEELLKYAEVLGLYARALKEGKEEAVKFIEELLNELRKIRVHYRKNQMLIFPYLERRGITAVPRVLWGREDQVIAKMRELREAIEEFKDGKRDRMEKIASLSEEISNEVMDLIFRENKILYPSCWALFSDGEWAAIHEIAEDMEFIKRRGEWSPKAEPVYPYQLIPEVKDTSMLPAEIRALASSATPDNYEIRREGDIEISTGFLNAEELEKILRNLPVELTFADENDRIRFYTESSMRTGFIRTKTLIGRRLNFCHPPRLESYVMLNIKKIKEGEFPYREFWTRSGDRILRVIVAGIRDDEGRYLGTLEMVEDMTEILKNPEEIMKKIMIL